MKRWFLALLSATLILAAIGCKKSEEPSNTGSKTTPTTDTAANNAPTAEMMKCDGCGAMHNKADMVEVDGKMMCKDCADKAKADKGSGGT